MIASVVNAIAIIIGGLIGTLSQSKAGSKLTGGLMTVMGFVTASIGIISVTANGSFLVLVLSLVIGTVIGMLIKLDDAINNSGEWAKRKLSGLHVIKGNFGDAFVTASILFAVGTMTVLGSIKAGLDKDYSILFTKSIMDFVSALAFSSAMGSGVIFACIPVFVIQGTITLLASFAEPLMPIAVVNEMTAVGGPIFLALAANILGIAKERYKVGDMIPAIFMPIVIYPLLKLLNLL